VFGQGLPFREERRQIGYGSSSRARATGVALTCSVMLAASGAGAQATRWSGSLSIQETLTNNVNLTPSSTAQGDLVTQLTPSVTINEAAARTSLSGNVSLPMLFYVKTGADNNTIYPQANLTGNVEAIEKFFFIEGTLSVTQQYFNPFGAQPSGLTNATDNRYTSGSYSLSPYIQGGARDIQYRVRDDNIWNTLNGQPFSTNNSYTNVLSANVGRQAPQLGWLAEYDRTSTRFNTQSPLLTQIARLTAFHSPDPQLQLGADVGYENNDYTFSQSRDTIYGISAAWRPSPRTNLDAHWEHRFFGSSYLFNFTNYTRLSTWNLSASRNITSYPQQIASIANVDTVSLLNQLFLSSIPDPIARQNFINQYIQQNGLPAFQATPVYFYTQTITLNEQASASVGLLGARNTIVFSAYYLRQQPITAAGTELPGVLQPENNTTQVGFSASWSHSLSANLSSSLSGSWYRTESNAAPGAPGFSGTTRQGFVTATLTSPLTANTSLTGGVRYQVLHTDPTFGSSYNEAAVFVGLSHQFR
jgi:uncharacterized protein (PEP-CTERM system associated)